MLCSGLGQCEGPDFKQSDFSIAAGRAKPAAHTFAVRETSIEQRHALYAPAGNP
jgi:hypothetical protein